MRWFIVRRRRFPASLCRRISAPLKIDVKDVQWKDAFVTIAINDLRGTREAIVLDWGGTKHPMLPGSQVPGYTTGATALLGGDQPIATEIQFSIPLDFNGSEGIFFAPFGVQNEATLKSNSPDVGFRGAFLPAERSLRPDGFDAKWKISYYGRDYPQSWTSRTGNERFTTQAVSNSLFGAQFLSILDAYRYVERSIKYGVLFLVLVFTTFFLFEVTARQKIHPFQYLMVGAALCLFYLLLLSISEFIGFSWAYLIAAVASIGVDHLVLPLFPGWRCAHVNDRRRTHGRLHISLHHLATTGLRAAHGRNRALHRAGDRDVRDAQGGLVRARRELRPWGLTQRKTRPYFFLLRRIARENFPSDCRPSILAPAPTKPRRFSVNSRLQRSANATVDK